MQSVSREEEVKFLGHSWKRTFRSKNFTGVLPKFRGKVKWEHVEYNGRGALNMTEVTDETPFVIERHGPVSKHVLEGIYQEHIIEHKMTY